MLKTLENPIKRWTTGKCPKYSLLSKLHNNYKHMTQQSLLSLLQAGNILSKDNKPTKLAVKLDLIAKCENKYLWQVEKVKEYLNNEGLNIERQWANQELPNFHSSEPQWVNLGTIGTYFNVSSTIIGRWLSELGVRDNKGNATEEALELKLANIVEMSAGPNKNQTRKITQWNLAEILTRLVKAGHPLDFDYESSLKGSGKNSEVKVVTVDSQAKELAQEFSKLFKNPKTRGSVIELVKNVNPIVIKKAESLLGKPGFISSGRFKDFI